MKIPDICSSWDRHSQISICFLLQSAVFKILHILGIFPLTPMLKFQTSTKFLKLRWLSRKVIALFYHGSQCHHKVWLKLEENCRRTSFLKFPTSYDPDCKISLLFFFLIWQIAKKVISSIPPDCHVFNKIRLKMAEHGGSSSLLKILNIGMFSRSTEWSQIELKWVSDIKV